MKKTKYFYKPSDFSIFHKIKNGKYTHWFDGHGGSKGGTMEEYLEMIHGKFPSYSSDDLWFELTTKEKEERLTGYETKNRIFRKSRSCGFSESINKAIISSDEIWNELNEEQKKEVLASAPDIPGVIDWNTLSLDQLSEYLEEKYKFSSTGESLAIQKLIEYFRNTKPIDGDAAIALDDAIKNSGKDSTNLKNRK